MGCGYYWIGLYQQDDGTYKWVDDSYLFYDNWGVGQPGRSLFITGGDQGGDGLWVLLDRVISTG